MARPDYFVLSHSMRRQTVITKKRRGPPATGKGTLLGVRLQPALLGRLDEWAESQEDKPSRPEAIRRLVEKALPPVRPKRTSPPGERTAKATKREADTRIRFVARSTRSCPLLRSDGACALRARCEAMRSRKGVRGGRDRRLKLRPSAPALKPWLGVYKRTSMRLSGGLLRRIGVSMQSWGWSAKNPGLSATFSTTGRQATSTSMYQNVELRECKLGKFFS
jgi:hypothetical protein